MVPSWQCPHPHHPYRMLPTPSHTTMSLLNILIWLFFELLHLLGSTIFDSPFCIACVSQNDKQESRNGMIRKNDVLCWLFVMAFFFPKQKLERSDRMHFLYKSWITIAELPSIKIFPIYFPTSNERVSPSFQWWSVLGIIFYILFSLMR